jgi:hypothetical protein
MKKYDDIGVAIPEVLLPTKEVNLTKWAVIACDQYTSQPDYWHKVEFLAQNAPSTFHMVYPEIYLEESDKEIRIKKIQEAMKTYLSNGIFEPFEGLIYVERKIKNGKTRHGIMLALDLEKYDYNKGSQTLIRATEGTIIDRLPPRISIRQEAPIEIPHIMVLIDDPSSSIIESLEDFKSDFKSLYNFDLMLDGGHVEGFAIDPITTEKIISGIRNLTDPKIFKEKYNLSQELPILLFAMGDGNHSLATAKAIWEKNKQSFGMNHPSRYALVEIVNIHDSALEFEPIHRVLFKVKNNIFQELSKYYGTDFSYEQSPDMNSAINATNINQSGHAFAIVTDKGWFVSKISNPKTNLPVGTLQGFIDSIVANSGVEKIDYVHGNDAVSKLGSIEGNVGFYLPPMKKSDLFKTVILDGALPRKTFSMGEADEKRFYLECRKII